MEKTKENIIQTITNILAPEDIDADYIPYICEAYLQGKPIEEVAHPSKGSIFNSFDECLPSHIENSLQQVFDRYNPSAKQKFEDNAVTIMVKVGDYPYETYIDENGVQRFRSNSVIRSIVDKDPYMLNDLAISYQEGKFSDKDFLDFYTSFGYSVSGLVDLSRFTHLNVENPVCEDGWEETQKS
jgi:hypothetical protein